LGFDIAHGEAKLAALAEAVDAEPPGAGQKTGEIYVMRFCDVLPVRFWESCRSKLDPVTLSMESMAHFN
jgi:hypothetical protein